MKEVIEVIADRCLGCHTCELECALAHSPCRTFTEAVTSAEYLFPRIILERDGESTVPMHCRHCDDAPCIAVCPTSAMSRRSPEDPVELNTERCIGCNGCILVCPFGIIRKVAAIHSLGKCDLCASRLREGEIPACAAACPTRAIRYIPVEELTAERRKEILGRFKVSLEKSRNLEE